MAENEEKSGASSQDSSGEKDPELSMSARNAIDAYLKQWLKWFVVGAVAVNAAVGAWLFSAIKLAAVEAAQSAAQNSAAEKIGQFNFYVKRMGALEKSASEKSSELQRAVGSVIDTTDRIKKNANEAEANSNRLLQINQTANETEARALSLNDRFRQIEGELQDPKAIVSIVQQLNTQQKALADRLAENQEFAARVRGSTGLTVYMGHLPMVTMPHSFDIPRPSKAARLFLMPPPGTWSSISVNDQAWHVRLDEAALSQWRGNQAFWLIFDGTGVMVSRPIDAATTQP